MSWVFIKDITLKLKMLFFFLLIHALICNMVDNCRHSSNMNLLPLKNKNQRQGFAPLYKPLFVQNFPFCLQMISIHPIMIVVMIFIKNAIIFILPNNTSYSSQREWEPSVNEED